jgi:hypothetical protein
VGVACAHLVEGHRRGQGCQDVDRHRRRIISLPLEFVAVSPVLATTSRAGRCAGNQRRWSET